MDKLDNISENHSKGYVGLFRSFIDWEWFTEPNMVTVFIYCLLKANYKDNRWRGIEIKKGSFITSYNTISVDTGLSVQKVRTCVKKLLNTGELTSEPTNKNTLLTVVKYDVYQRSSEDINKQDNIQSTFNQHSTNIQLTTDKNYNNYNKDKNKPKDEEFLIYEKSNFLEDWNELRTEHLNKKSFLNQLNNYDFSEFKNLRESYTREDFRNAMIGLFKQKKLPNDNSIMQSNPTHFLKFFNSYLTAYHDKNQSLYGQLQNKE